MFAAGISATGMAHQTTWLFSGEPFIEGGMREPANRTKSQSNLRQIGLALVQYNDTVKSLPAGGTFDALGRGQHGWQTFLLPYLEEKKIFDQINFKVAWDHPDNAPPFRTELPIFLHPSEPQRMHTSGWPLSHYSGNVRLIGGEVPRSLTDIPDGAANTILAGEAAGNYRPWGSPINWRDPALGINRTPEGFGNPSQHGASFVFADASVRYLTNQVSPQVLRALSTRDGGEALPKDWDK
jgi:hypothetical protein